MSRKVERFLVHSELTAPAESFKFPMNHVGERGASCHRGKLSQLAFLIIFNVCVLMKSSTSVLSACPSLLARGRSK